MNTRLAITALIAALALSACDQSANKPKAAAPATDGAGRSAPAAATPSPNLKPAAARSQSPAPVAEPKASIAEPKATPAATPPPSATPTIAPAATPTPAAPQPQAPQTETVLKHTETNSGLIIEDMKFGEGVEAKPHQTVTIHYRGTLPNGTEFDSSYKSGKPATFGLDSLIKGWQEGIPGMKIGGKRRLIVPPDLGYGAREIKGPNGQVLIPANSMLIFDIELFGVQ